MWIVKTSKRAQPKNSPVLKKIRIEREEAVRHSAVTRENLSYKLKRYLSDGRNCHTSRNGSSRCYDETLRVKMILMDSLRRGKISQGEPVSRKFGGEKEVDNEGGGSPGLLIAVGSGGEAPGEKRLIQKNLTQKTTAEKVSWATQSGSCQVLRKDHLIQARIEGDNKQTKGTRERYAYRWRLVSDVKSQDILY